MKRSRTVVFRCDASNEKGMGHLVRCISFLEGISVRVLSHFILQDMAFQDSITAPLNERDWSVSFLPYQLKNGQDAEQTARLSKECQADLLVTDLCHHETLAHPMSLVDYHRKLKRLGVPFVLSIEDCRMAAFASDAAIIWNCGNEQELSLTPLDDCRIYAGFEYFICRPQFSFSMDGRRFIRQPAKNILVCISGSDRAGVTAKVAKALATFYEEELCVKILLGQAFTPELNREVESICSNHPDLSALSYSNEMVELLLWADLTIVGEGLVKFEAAITGTPALIISQIDHDSGPIREFNKIGCSRYVGDGRTIKIAEIVASVRELMENFEKRKAMSRKGMAALDGCAMERIEKRILKTILEDDH